MRTYTIPTGTRIWRSSLPVEEALASLTAAGATLSKWQGMYTEHQVTYNEADRLALPADSPKPYVQYYYFRLPPAAAPWTVIEVVVSVVKIQK